MSRRLLRALAATCLVALPAAGCSRSPAANTPAPADPVVVIEQFLAAVKANDLATMGQLWGTSKGPAAGRMNRNDLEKRLTIMVSYLSHESYVMEPGSVPAASPDERILRVRLTRKGCTPVVPFTVVRYGSGWLVSAIDLEAAGNPVRPCN